MSRPATTRASCPTARKPCATAWAPWSARSRACPRPLGSIAPTAAGPRPPPVRAVYPKPELETVLGKTLGVSLFQEQAMQVAIEFGGFTASEADLVRRAMTSGLTVRALGSLPRRSRTPHTSTTARRL
jgi:hypothetical protein